MPGLDTNRGAKRAFEARERLGVATGDPVDSLLDLVEAGAGIPVVVLLLPGDVAGACWQQDDQRLIFVNGTHPVVRQRFTLAHEFGHVCCGHDRGLEVDTVLELVDGRQTTASEVQANAFAAELLLPKAGVLARVAPGCTPADVRDLAERHGVSTLAAIYRLRTLGIVDDEQRDALLDELVELPAGPPTAERLGTLDLPYLSPALAGSGLALLLEGRAEVAAVAAASDQSTDRFQAAMARLDPVQRPTGGAPGR